MASPALKPLARPLGPGANGILMTPRAFDAAEFDNDWRYELINGVVIVSPFSSNSEADANDHLGQLLRLYKETHPDGAALDATLPERYVAVGPNRRRPDRVIWAGLGRLPRRGQTPTIIVEFVSERRRDQIRDYETKRDEYLGIGVREYWVIDQFQRILTVFIPKPGRMQRKVVRETQVYRTPVLPGFELPLAALLASADQWADEQGEDAAELS